MLALILTATWVSLLAATIAGAFRRGEWEERLGSAAILTGWFASEGVVHALPKWSGIHLGLFAVDALLLIALAAIAVRSKKTWPLWAAAAQLGQVALHVAYLFGHVGYSPALFAAFQFTSFGCLGATAAGAFEVWRGHGGQIARTGGSGL